LGEKWEKLLKKFGKCENDTMWGKWRANFGKMCGKGMVRWENDGEMYEGKISWGYMGKNERRG
jgi:hypothetical protein